MILLDTNVLLRYANPVDPAYLVARTAISTLTTAGDTLCLVPQNFYEFWAVATRPIPNNGLGLSIAECQQETSLLKTAFTLLGDHPSLFAEWEGLVVTYSCHGRVSYDARLVAAMRTHGLTRILTFNGTDFARYPGIKVMDPHTVAASAPPPNPIP